MKKDIHICDLFYYVSCWKEVGNDDWWRVFCESGLVVFVGPGHFYGYLQGVRRLEASTYTAFIGVAMQITTHCIYIHE